MPWTPRDLEWDTNGTPNGLPKGSYILKHEKEVLVNMGLMEPWEGNVNPCSPQDLDYRFAHLSELPIG